MAWTPLLMKTLVASRSGGIRATTQSRLGRGGGMRESRADEHEAHRTALVPAEARLVCLAAHAALAFRDQLQEITARRGGEGVRGRVRIAAR